MTDKKNAVVITGANGNIASDTVKILAEEGLNLILLYHNTTHRIDAILQKFHNSVKGAGIDILNREQIEEVLKSLITESGFRPKALIHTAAMRSVDSASLIDTTPELWSRIIETNVIGTYNILKVMIPFLKVEKTTDDNDNLNRIVLLGSDVSRIGLPNGSAYAASKAAISNLTRSLAHELAEHNILINTVSPGPVSIDDSHFSEDYRRFRVEYYAEMLKRTPLKRLAKTSDIASLCYFLISSENKYITGEEFFLTGGKL